MVCLSPAHPRGGGLAILFVAVLLVPALPGLGAGTGTHAVPPAPLPPTWAAPAAVGRLGHLPMALPRPSASNEFYTQIGATLSEINNTYAVTGLKTLSERIPLVTSLYPIGYELNLLSDTGDWYQVVVGDNWPGCNAGFEEILEVWDSHGNSGPVVCDASVSLSKGNLVELNGSFPSASTGCLGLDDLTTHRSHVVCQTQPDTGASQYVFLGSAANGDGYYTGTMTEIVNLSASSCPDYTHMPTVTFDFPSWAHITAFVPWSDEWNNVPSGTFCYSNSAGGVYLPGPSPASHYVDSTGGSVYGPQSVQGQNDTLLNASVGFRFQSDPKPLTGESLSTSATTLAPGGTVTLESTTSGGIAPYGTLWEYDGAFGNGHVGSWWNYSTFTPGNYTFVAFGTDAQGDAIASASVTVRVPYPLKVGSLSASTGSGADVGQTVNVSARASGGVDPLSYAWTGLPAGCGSADLPWADCVPAAPGNTTIFLSVTDANGSTVRTPGLFFSVSPRLGVSLSASRTIADLDQRSLFEATASGGSGGLTYGWSGLPSGCSAGGASANCSLTSAGEFVVGVTVADSNHVSVTPASVVLVVHPALSASLSASAGLVDVGRPVTLTAAVSGGSGADQYAWSGLPAGCVGANAPALRCVPSNSSSFWVGVLVTDRANASVAPAPVSLYVYPLLTLRLAVNSTRLTAPATVTISPSVLGGSDLVNATWSSVPSGCEATGFHPARCADLGAGNYSITLRVDDVGHGNATTTFAFTVATPTPPPPPPGPGGLSTGTIEVALGLLALVIVGVAIALARRRNSSG